MQMLLLSHQIPGNVNRNVRFLYFPTSNNMTHNMHVWIVCFSRLYRNEISRIKGLMDLASVVGVLFFKCGNSIVAKETYGNPCSIHEHALLLFPSSLRCIPKLLTNDGRSEKWSRNDDNLIKSKKKSVRTRRDIDELTLSNVGSKVIF